MAEKLRIVLSYTGEEAGETVLAGPFEQMTDEVVKEAETSAKRVRDFGPRSRVYSDELTLEGEEQDPRGETTWKALGHLVNELN